MSWLITLVSLRVSTSIGEIPYCARDDNAARLEPKLRSAIDRPAKCRETKNLRVLFIGQIIDASKNGEMPVDLVFRGEVYE